MKKLLSYCVLALSLFIISGCQGTPQNQIIKKVPETTKVEFAKLSDCNQAELSKLSDFNQTEIKDAIKLGIVPSGLEKGDFGRCITLNELEELFHNTLKYMGKDWQRPIDLLNDKKELTRDEGATIIGNAIKTGLKITKGNGYVKSYSMDYTFKEELGDFNHIDDSPWLLISMYDIKADAPIMEQDQDGNFRFSEPFTVQEAISAAYRTTNCIMPDETFIDMKNVIPYKLSEKQMELVMSMPLPTAKKLPNWRGLNIERQHGFSGMSWGTIYFTEGQILAIKNSGFNFVRVALNYYNMFESENSLKINKPIIENLDALIGWCAENKIHICLEFHCLPGYQTQNYAPQLVNSVDDFFTNKKRQETAYEVFSFLAEHYKNIPSNLLSFNPYNEPLVAMPELESESACYYPIAKATIEAIRKKDPNRFLIFDGTRINAGAPARTPVKELVNENVAQSFHYYGEDSTDIIQQVTDGYMPQGWPLPYVNGFLNEEAGGLVIKGKFAKDSKVEVSIEYIAGIGKIALLSNGKVLNSMEISEHTVGKNDCIEKHDDVSGSYNLKFTSVLKEDTKNLEIKFISKEYPFWALQVNHVVIITPDKNIETPYIEKYGWRTLLGRVTNIICDPYNFQKAGSSCVTVDEKGHYSNPAQEKFAFNKDAIKRSVSKWAKFSKENDVAIMAQEFGLSNCMKHEVSNAYLDDFLSVLDEYQIPWSMWGFWDSSGIANSRSHDVKCEKFGPYYIDYQRLNVLQKHMK